MENLRPEDFTLEEGPMGPIGEGEALILRVNRNCPWNRCLFCHVYKGRTYNARSVREIKADIDAVRRIRDLLEETSWGIGLQGRISREGIRQTVTEHPAVYGDYPHRVNPTQWAALRSLQNVGNWLLCGAQRVFMQDANALALKPGSLLEVLLYLKDVLPTVQTVTTYARSRTYERRSSQELKDLSEAGLSWSFVGIESGCNEVLEAMKKGVTAEEHVRGGVRLREAGIRMAAFVMPGLAGGNRELSLEHMRGTLDVLNKIRPEEVRVRSLAVVEGSPLYEKWRNGEFQACPEDRLVEEMKMLVEGLEVDCTLETLQMTNPLFTVKGPLSGLRELLLHGIREYQNLPSAERAGVLLNQYTEGGYLKIVRGWGRYDGTLASLVEEAKMSVRQGSRDAPEKVDRAVFAIKSKGVP
jgi:hypothetical protein